MNISLTQEELSDLVIVYFPINATVSGLRLDLYTKFRMAYEESINRENSAMPSRIIRRGGTEVPAQNVGLAEGLEVLGGQEEEEENQRIPFPPNTGPNGLGTVELNRQADTSGVYQVDTPNGMGYTVEVREVPIAEAVQSFPS